MADNIRYARPDGDRRRGGRGGRAQIGGGEWLAALPQGLATEVGERGRSLSLGQRQLVALARVLLQDPSIFILDEATASVDPLTEAQIQEGLDVVLEDRTAIVIAHRLSTIRHADRIIVLRQGRIIEEGSHDALMRARRPLRRAVQHLLPPPVARLPPRRGLRARPPTRSGAGGRGSGGVSPHRAHLTRYEARSQPSAKIRLGARFVEQAAEVSALPPQTWLLQFSRVSSASPSPSARRRTASVTAW